MTQGRICSKHTLVLAACLISFAGDAWPQDGNPPKSQSVDAGSGKADDTNAANNPLESLVTVDLQNRFVPSPQGFAGRIADQDLLRVAVPLDSFGIHQFIRVILPVNTTPVPQGGPNTGVGDLTVYDILPFQVRGITLGVGPLIAAPTARGDAYGSGKWQAGGAAAAIRLESWGLLAVLVTSQHSFSGNSNGPVGGITTVQPFFFYHFRRGLYFRSSAVWTFDTFHHERDIPVGFGLGKVWKRSGGEIVNLYVEPQYSVFSSGMGSPTWQIFAGATFKFRLAKR